MRPVTSSCPQSLLWIAHCWPTLASLGPVHGGLWQGGVFLQVPTSHPKALAHREWSVGLCLLLTSHHHSNLHSFSPCPTGLPLPPQCVFIWFHLFWEDRKHHGCQVAFACWTSWNGERKYFKNKQKLLFPQCCYFIFLFCIFYFLDPLNQLSWWHFWQKPDQLYMYILRALVGGIRLE